MSDKEIRSVYLECINDEFLDGHDNASALINDLVTQYRRNGDRGVAGLKLHRKQKVAALEAAQNKVERLEGEVAELDALIQEFKRDEDAELERAREELSATPRDPDNPAIQNWAEKLGITPTELLDELSEDTA